MKFNVEKITGTLTTGFIIITLVVIGIAILLFVFRKKIKRVVMPSVYLITGAVKTGKTSTSIWLAWSEYIRKLFGYICIKHRWIFVITFFSVMTNNPNDFTQMIPK